MASVPLRRLGLLAAGLALGLGLVGLGLWFYLQAAQVGELETALEGRLQLPAEALELEEITPEGRLRIRLRDVVLLERGGPGDTVAVVPSASFWFDPQSIAGEGPLLFSDVVLREPELRLVQRQDGEWNLFQALEVRAAGEEVAPAEEGKPFLFRDVQIQDAQIAIAIPAEPLDTASFAAELQIPRITLGGEPYQLYRLRGVDAEVPEFWLGGEQGWRARVASASGLLLEPELPIRDLQLRIASEGEEAIRFDLGLLRFGDSRVAGEGLLTFEEDRTLYDVRLRAERLAFADVRALLPSVPAEGSAAFALEVEPLAGERTRLTFQELDVSALDARASGRLTAVVGGEGPVTFLDTRVALESLELSTLEELGLVEDLPLAGTVRGTVATPDEVTAGPEGGLFLDLTASLTPRDQPGAEPSVIAATGGVQLGGEQPVVLDGVRLQLQPLYLSLLRPFAPPEQAERLQGVARGTVTLSGTPRDLRFQEGQLAYAVGDAEPTRLADLRGSVSLDPALTYQLSATAQPLALATLTELFPALPFRTATLSGPIEVSGTAEEVRLSADLQGAAGGFQVAGTVGLGEVPRFDLQGSVRSLAAASLIRGELPVEGAVTGTFAVEGTAADLRFDVDLAQTAGRFALRGRLLRGEGPAVFDVSGQVTDFRLGALLGRPGLFAGPLSGALSLGGGGDAPYRFDVDLRGEDGLVLNVEGSYAAAAAVPTYDVRGRVAGLDLSRLPLAVALPRSDLNATLNIQGQGTTLETLQGSYAIDATGSTIGGVPVDAALVRAEARQGVFLVDTLALVLRDTRLSAEGGVGLTRPAPVPLRFAFVSPDLRTLARLAAARQQIPPEVAGELRAEGTVAGTVRYPAITASVQGRRLRFNQWAAATLALGAQVARTAEAGWAGQATLQADEVVLGTFDRLATLRAELEGTQEQLGVGLFARRQAGPEVALSGLVELEGRVPRGVRLESLALRLEETAWTLAGPARVRWGGVDGVLVQNLLLQRAGGESGLIRVDGSLPPTGVADLQVQVRALDLALLRELTAAAPEIEGVLDLDAVLEGPVADPGLTVTASIDSLRYQGATADSVSVTARYGERALLAGASVWGGGQQLLDAEARIPLRLSISELLPSFELLRQEPLSARIAADSIGLGLLTAAVPTLAEGTGTLTALATVGGTLERPQLEGYAALRDGAVRVLPLGVRYEGIVASLSLEDQVVRIDSLLARSAGTARLSGSVRFGQTGGPNVYLLAALNGFRAMDVEEVAQVTVSGELALSGDLPNPVLTGEATIDESTFRIPELDERSTVEITDVEIGQIGPDTATVGGFGPALLAGLRVDGLVVNVGESVWLVSEDARIQIAGENLVVYRSGEELRVFGVLRAERGTYTLRVGPLTREFEIEQGQVRFFGTEDFNPDLDIVAINRIRTLQSGDATSINVIVNITGTVQFPRIQLTSDTRPPLPESEILSLLLFGQPSFELGGAAGGLAQEVLVQEALGGVLFAPLEQLFLRTGLVDFVQFRSAGDQIGQSLGLTTVAVGTQLADNVFLTVECGVGIIFGGGAGGCGTQVQVELGRNFTASAAYEPVRRERFQQILLGADQLQYQWSAELRRRWEFGVTDAPSPLEDLPGRPEALPGEVRR